jgi:hypothetical protein
VGSSESVEYIADQKGERKDETNNNGRGERRTKERNEGRTKNGLVVTTKTRFNDRQQRQQAIEREIDDFRQSNHCNDLT